MSQSPESFNDVMPCSSCGCQALTQEVEQTETINVGEDGYIETIEVETIEVQAISCPECGKKLWTADE